MAVVNLLKKFFCNCCN